LADQYKVTVTWDTGPFEVKPSDPLVINKSDIKPAPPKKADAEKK